MPEGCFVRKLGHFKTRLGLNGTSAATIRGSEYVIHPDTYMTTHKTKQSRIAY